MTAVPQASAGPLAGVRILELAAIGPAPFAGALLADLGADVVRVDRLPTPGQAQVHPPRFDFYNRNKRSVAVDLKRPEGVQTVLQLVRGADALTEGFRPGVLERLGLAPATLLAANPRLVIGRMTGWGQDGPLALEAGHDINYLALTGALHAIGEPGGPPVPPLNLVADLGGGAMYLAVGILSAVLEARQSGRGQVVDAAMLDGITNLMSAFQAYRQQGQWEDERGRNIVDGGAPFYGCYETADGRHVAVGAIEPPFYAALLAVMAIDPATLPPQNDRTQWPAMRERFAAVFRTRTRDAWVQAAAGRDACLAPVLSIDEAPAHPQMRARQVYADFDAVRHPAPAPRLSRTPASLRPPASTAARCWPTGACRPTPWPRCAAWAWSSTRPDSLPSKETPPCPTRASTAPACLPDRSSSSPAAAAASAAAPRTSCRRWARPSPWSAARRKNSTRWPPKSPRTAAGPAPTPATSATKPRCAPRWRPCWRGTADSMRWSTTPAGSTARR